MDFEGQVIDAVRVHPGLSSYQLSVMFGIEEAKFCGVAEALAEAGRLRRKQEANSVRWYDPAAAVSEQAPAVRISPGTGAWEALVLTAGAADRGITIAELKRRVSKRRGYAELERVMGRLQDAGLVRGTSSGAKWIATPVGRERVADEQGRLARMRGRKSAISGKTSE